MADLSEIIKAEFSTGKTNVEISYSCGTTPINSAYIDIKIGNTQYNRISEYGLKEFKNDLARCVDTLKEEPCFSDLHTISRKKEFHFLYSGFNSCSREDVPVSLSNENITNEPIKTGKVTERHSMVGTSKVMEIINQHPDYELYSRYGFSMRGAQESQTDLDGIKKLCEWACCLDVEVIDNEIHVNGFSVNDMM